MSRAAGVCGALVFWKPSNTFTQETFAFANVPNQKFNRQPIPIAKSSDMREELVFEAACRRSAPGTIT